MDSVRLRGDLVAPRQTIPSKRILCGSSRDVDRPSRLKGSSKNLFWAEAAKDITLRDLHVELAPESDFTTGLMAAHARRVRVQRMRFTAPFGPREWAETTNAETPTLMAVLTKGAFDVTVEDVILDGTQLKLNGGSRLVRVRKLESYRAQNFGLSVVTSKPEEITRDVVIEGEPDAPLLFESPNNGGVYLGVDSDRPKVDGAPHGGELHNCTVKHVIVRTSATYNLVRDKTDGSVKRDHEGHAASRSFGFVARIGQRASNWYFDDLLSEPTDPAVRPLSGLRIKSIDEGGGRLEGFTVSRARCYNSDLADIFVQLKNGGYGTIQHSEAIGGRGVEIRGHGVVTLADVVSIPRMTSDGVNKHPALTLVGEGGQLVVNEVGCDWQGPIVKQGDVVYYR